MKYHNIAKASFLDRPNRFIAHVELDGKVETVHVKNTGRCKELRYPGVPVILERSANENRKTAYDLVTVYKEGIGWINMDSQAPDRVAGEFLAGIEDIVYIKPEYKYGQSRIDFYFDRKTEKGETVPCLMEVKGVTLERDHIAYFPDAPTERGVRHIRELQHALTEGYESYLLFVIQMEGVQQVYPNDETHPEFGAALREAEAAGVRVLRLCCQVSEDTVTGTHLLP